MGEVTKYPSGTFSWIDLSTSDQDGAKAFYQGVFGWEATDEPMPMGGMYTMLRKGGKAVAGLSQMQPEMAASGMPPTWNSYITAHDLDGTLAKAKEAGATVISEPFDVMEEGRMAVIQDPTGAIVSLWKPINHIGAELVNEPNTLVWNELATRDTEAAGEFFKAVFAWDVGFDDTGYGMFSRNGRMDAGMMDINSPDWEGVPAHWNIYFLVEDAQATAAKVKELGGTMMQEPFQAGETGVIGIARDPQGAVFMFIYMDPALVDAPPAA